MDKEIQNHIVIITCVAEKSNIPCSAKDMYIGELFKDLMQYAHTLNPSRIFILSGKYHLLELDDIVKPYDVNLSKMSEDYQLKWAEVVLKQLKEKTDLKTDHFVFLTSKLYVKNLIEHIDNYEMPREIL